jgi:Relaxase/Mobilisation nuclease domain
MKSPAKSRFGKLVAYLLDPQDKKTRVGEIVITNCDSPDTTWAVREIAATQWLNTRAKSARTYHLIISLKDGAQTLRMIEERFCNALGYAEHQRISVVHHDTDNVHIHVAINKIHPESFTLHNPGYDYKTRSKLCGLLEHELGLAQDNHQRGQTRGNDVTPKSGQESFQAWLQRHAQGFIDATSWEEFHGIADAHGVRLDLRANGFVFTNRRSLIHVKASSIDRRLAKPALEARLGTFVAADYEQGREKQEYQKKPRFGRVDTSQLWEEYQAQRELRKTLRQASS